MLESSRNIPALCASHHRQWLSGVRSHSSSWGLAIQCCCMWESGADTSTLSCLGWFQLEIHNRTTLFLYSPYSSAHNRVSVFPVDHRDGVERDPDFPNVVCKLDSQLLQQRITLNATISISLYESVCVWNYRRKCAWKIATLRPSQSCLIPSRSRQYRHCTNYHFVA